MRKLLLATVAAGALLAGAGGALASPHDDEDDVPGAGWRSASELEATLESQGWQVDRVKADDGQWEVYGRDPNGNYVEANYDPRTLQQTSVKAKNGAGSGSSKPKKDQRRDGNGRDKGKDKDRAGKGDKNK